MSVAHQVAVTQESYYRSKRKLAPQYRHQVIQIKEASDTTGQKILAEDIVSERLISLTYKELSRDYVLIR